MNKTNIDWCDYTWNPITGCLHGCEYCYARAITQRFHNHYTNGFQPTFHPQRFIEKPPGKPSKIFVGSMGDLFGDWYWHSFVDGFNPHSGNNWPAGEYHSKNVIEEILAYCRSYPQHTFIFLTKNPAGMKGYKFPDNCWCGVTVTDQCDRWRIVKLREVECKVKFISAEPLIKAFSMLSKDNINWVIVGAMTGNNKLKTQKQSVSLIRIAAKEHLNIPLFIKNNVYKSYPDLPEHKEFPKERLITSHEKP